MERQFANALRQTENCLKRALGQEIKVLRIQSFYSIIVSRILSFLEKFDEKDFERCGWPGTIPVEEFKRHYVHRSSSFAASDINDEPLVIVLAEATLHKTFVSTPSAGCMLTSIVKLEQIQMICSSAFLVLSDFMGLRRG